MDVGRRTASSTPFSAAPSSPSCPPPKLPKNSTLSQVSLNRSTRCRSKVLTISILADGDPRLCELRSLLTLSWTGLLPSPCLEPPATLVDRTDLDSGPDLSQCLIPMGLDSPSVSVPIHLAWLRHHSSFELIPSSRLAFSYRSDLRSRNASESLTSRVCSTTSTGKSAHYRPSNR